MAAGALTALKITYRVILHLSVIGFDDIPIRYTDPPVDTVRYPCASMAKIATELALQGLQALDITATHCFMPTTVRRHSWHGDRMRY